MEQAYYANSSATAETFQRYCLLDTDEPVISIVSKEMRFEALTSEATQRGVRGEPWELGAAREPRLDRSALARSAQGPGGALGRHRVAPQSEFCPRGKRLRANLPLKSPFWEGKSRTSRGPNRDE